MAASSLHQWCRIKTGTCIPENAVAAGETRIDGKIWVGRIGGEVGKINVTVSRSWKDFYVMHAFRHHGDGSLWGASSCEILCCTAASSWVPIKRGDLIPHNAVCAGETRADVATYVGRSAADGEAGKINTKDGNMLALFCHSKVWSGLDSGEILVFDVGEAYSLAPPMRDPAQAPLSEVQSRHVYQGGTTSGVVQTGQPHRPVYQEKPAAPENFPGISALAESDLRFLEANPIALDDWLMSLPQIKLYSEQARKLGDENKEAAQKILAREPVVSSAHLASRESCEALRKRHESVQALLQERDRIVQRQSPEKLALVLQARAEAADASAEASLQQLSAVPGRFDPSRLAEFRQNYLRQKATKHRNFALAEGLSKSKETAS